MAITKQKGDIAEAFVVYLFKKNGFNVLIPWGEDNRYDLVTEKNNVFKRIQVKYATPKNGVIEVRARSCNNYNIIHYSPKNIDVIAVYTPDQHKVYLVPFSLIKNKSTCNLRLNPAKNKQLRFVTEAAKYESRFDLLEK